MQKISAIAKRLTFLSAFIFILSLLSMQELLAKPIRFGFIGGRSPENLVLQWSPLVDHLRHETGLSIEMVLREDYQGLIDALVNDEIDLYEGGAFSHIKAMETGQAESLAQKNLYGKNTYSTYIITRADDKATSILDLKGRKIALVNELSASGYVVPRLMFADAGIEDPDSFFSQIILTGYHDFSMEAVTEGIVDAAAIGDFFLKKLPSESREKYKIIAESWQIPFGPITVSKKLSPEIKSSIEKALLSYEQKVSDEIRRQSEADSFTLQDESSFDILRAYDAKIQSLPKIKYAVPYRRIPAVFSDTISSLRKHAIILVSAIFVSFAIILIVVGFFVRRRFSNLIGLAIAGIIAFVAATFTILQLTMLNSSMEAYALKRVSEMQSANLSAVAAFANSTPDDFNKVINELKQDEVIVSAKIFGNGIIIASSNPSDNGMLVVDYVRSGLFKPKIKNTVTISDPIIVGGRQYATLQLTISFVPMIKMVDRAILINLIAMVVALLTGLLSTIFSRRRLKIPIEDLSVAVDKIRDGIEPQISKSDGDVGKVAVLISKLGQELAQKQRLMELKISNTIGESDGRNKEITEEIRTKIKEMETQNELFRKVRMTEAIGESPIWLRTMCDAAIRARDRDPVVIVGPTGSGKTGVAHAIHSLSTRATGPFAEFNCAEFASADPLVVLSKLFGYGTDCGIAGIDRRGQKGILEEFEGGTLFFDEVQLLPMQAQQLLLLPLEGRPYNPASGKGRAKTANVRYIFASNESLDELAHSGKLRRDLLRRIRSRGVICVPPLADRKSDIESIALEFLAKRNMNSDMQISFTKEALNCLTKYDFDHYNVSELRGTIDQAYDSAQFEGTSQIQVKHLSKEINSYNNFVSNHPGKDEPFDDEEKAELQTLRKWNFNITRAEKELGLSPGSKTLTNHLRGIVYGSLVRNDYNLEKAVREIVGDGANGKVFSRIKIKVHDYLSQAVRNIKESEADKLFRHLPQKYNVSAEKIISAIRKGLLSA